MNVPGQESANAHTGPPWTLRINGNGPSPCGNVSRPWISRPSDAAQVSACREAMFDRTISVPSFVVETIVRGSWPETTTSSGGRAAELSVMATSSPTGAAARKKPSPASRVAHRSFAIPVETSTSSTTVSRPRMPVATRMPSARQDRNATSTSRVSGRRTSPVAGSIRSRSPATTKRSLQTASTTATTSLVGELDDPSQLDVRLEQRPVGTGGRIDQHDTRVVPGALAGLLGRDRHDAVVLAPCRFPDVEIGTTRRPELAGGDLQDHQASTGAFDALEGLHLRDPRRQALYLPDHAGPHRVRLLGLQPRHDDQEGGARRVTRHGAPRRPPPREAPAPRRSRPRPARRAGGCPPPPGRIGTSTSGRRATSGAGRRRAGRW